ncbi:helix-turn-helix transcriptional regulator [Paenibacillus donghaensis]|uniref:HTH cro/C1-type domain-containing protein n=1 Tax=Paenibacillus donghaensis TaxID=414771 RepID=A0A2Z2KPB1_9BACL|nr:hypothetical protein B9T62_15465 [Paenibacillus donghaensis]
MAFLLGECLLLELLEQVDMSQAEFAKRLKCSRQYVGQLITKKDNATMSLEFAINAADVLGCSVNELYTLRETSSRKGH